LDPPLTVLLTSRQIVDKMAYPCIHNFDAVFVLSIIMTSLTI
jgi:hypothetical protein